MFLAELEEQARSLLKVHGKMYGSFVNKVKKVKKVKKVGGENNKRCRNRETPHQGGEELMP